MKVLKKKSCLTREYKVIQNLLQANWEKLSFRLKVSMKISSSLVYPHWLFISRVEIPKTYSIKNVLLVKRQVVKES